MKNLLFLLFLCILLASCGASKRKAASTNHHSGYIIPPRDNYPETSSGQNGTPYEPRTRKEKKIYAEEVNSVVNYALGYLGTDYKYGGTTKRGMDCSGLVYTAFINGADIFLPRTSRAMAKEGYRLLMNEIEPGDLLFFKTNRWRDVINHVALVVKVEPGKISFIHATTHGGVMISNLNQDYWKNCFFEARRVL